MAGAWVELMDNTVVKIKIFENKKTLVRSLDPKLLFFNLCVYVNNPNPIRWEITTPYLQ